MADYTGVGLLGVQVGRLACEDHQGPPSRTQSEWLVRLFEQGSVYQQVLHQRGVVMLDDLSAYPRFLQLFGREIGEQNEMMEHYHELPGA